MIGPKGFLADCQCPLVERLPLGILPLGRVQVREVVQALGHIWMVGPKGFLADCQCPLVERLRLVILSQGIISPPQLLQCGGSVWIFSSECLFRNMQSLRRKWESLVVFSLLLKLVNLRVELFPSRLLRQGRSRYERSNDQQNAEMEAIGPALHCYPPALWRNKLGIKRRDSSMGADGETSTNSITILQTREIDMESVISVAPAGVILQRGGNRCRPDHASPKSGRRFLHAD